MDMNHDFPMDFAARRKERRARRLQPESLAIVAILAAFWIFVIVRMAERLLA